MLLKLQFTTYHFEAPPFHNPTPVSD